MHRCGSGFLLTLAIGFVVAFTGCLGKSSGGSSSTVVSSVTLSPGGKTSMEIGATQGFIPTARNASGGAIAGATFQFILASGSPDGSEPLSITTGGNACAGTWDATGAICNQGTVGIAVVTAVSNGISSPPTTVYVHQHVESIQISSAQAQPPQYDCFSQGQTWIYKATAYGNGNPPVDITNSVGPFNWSFTNSGVVTTAPYTPPNQPSILNQVQVTAKSPGITQLSANVNGTTSALIPFTTCLIQAIYLQIGGQAQAGNSITVNNGGSIPVTVTAIDTLYGKVNGSFAGLSAPPLTWSTTNPEVAGFSAATSSGTSNSASARSNFGGATLFASCSPPSCNIGVSPGLPIYSSSGTLPNGTAGFGSISVDVIPAANATPPTYSAWAATTQCGNAPGCSSALFSVTPTTNTGTNPIGTIVGLPRTPNSMMFNHVAAPRIYIGTDQGLMYVDTSSANPTAVLVANSPTPCNVSLCGQVLAISNDGKQVVVGDNISVPSQVYLYNGSSATDLKIPGETFTAAAFSPDQLKIFILGKSGTMYVYSTVDALTSVSTVTPGTDVKFSFDGSFAYVAGSPTATSISAFATCDNQPTLATTGHTSVTTPGIPLQIFPSPDEQHVFVLDPANGSIDVFATTEERTALPYDQFTCNASPAPFVDLDPTVNFPATAQSFDLGQGKTLTPVYAQLVNDGAQMMIVARKVPAVLLLDVNSGQVTPIPLSSSTVDPLSASASPDGTRVFIAACDAYAQDGTTCAVGSIHIVSTTGQNDFQQVPYKNVNDNNDTNMCNDGGNPAPQCLPNLVAIKPL